MSLEALKQALPAYARDIGQNLSALADEALLSPQQKWGAFIAAAWAVGVAPVSRAVEAAATAAGLSETVRSAAKTAAAHMAMNNVYFRAVHLMRNTEYQAMPARLRRKVLADRGVDRTDFELWSLVVSAINGCAACLDAHEAELKKQGLSAQAIQAGLRIAAAVNAAARVMAAEAAVAA